MENLLVLLDFYDGLFKVYACQCGNFLLKFNLLFWHLSALPANDLPFVFMLSILMNRKWLACFFSKITETQTDQEAERRPILRERRPQPSNITELSALMARTRTARQSWIKTVILTGAVS